MNKEQLEGAIASLEVNLKVDLPRKLQGQPVELQAMINRMAQKSINGLKSIGQMTPDQIMQTQTDLNELQLKLKAYGTNVDK